MKATLLSIFVFSLLLINATILPQQSTLSKAVNYLSEYIASDHFLKLKQDNSEIVLIDSIYSRAINYFQNDYSEALLALTFATVPYREVPLEFPLLEIKLYFPLTSADEFTFNIKNENLPSHFLFDSPESVSGDKDKLAHFFGNAFIGYAESILDLADVFGYFVEAFEEDFKSQSEVDSRDMEINWYGVLFGNLLEENKNILPGEVLIIRTLRYNIFVL